MIIKIDFGDDFIQYISCSAKVGRKINNIQEDFLSWIFDKEKNTTYWTIENGERMHPAYDAEALVEWLNNVRFKRGKAKAKLIKETHLSVKKSVYF
ncbi:hypothetical protein QTG56_00785 [Rossellomorea sp. AcN35-11]|nr:hypothetical protein [Rossellomorea aquimaris]WJV29739.1 hypothetical protein QTG56_00785 [Rossellomorea sp. AcN35-11]